MDSRSLRRLLVIGVLVGAPRGSSAQPALLIESYAGERPADADRVLAPLRERLQHRGVATSAAAMAPLLGAGLPLPGSTNATLTVAELAERIDLGFKSALRGDYELALRRLEAALEAARESPSLVASGERARAWLTKALAGIAFARGRLGDPAGAAEAMAEQIRSFPEHPVTRDAFGPEAEQLYLATRRALAASAPGTLLVDVGEPDAQIYINEVDRGRGGAYARGLVPGTYRVLVEAAGVGRRYTVAVRAGEDARLSIDWDTDARLLATPRWVGFVWPRAVRDGPARIARRFARGGARGGVIVAEILRRGDRRFVVGHAYRPATGAFERAGAIELGARDAAKLVALADYLATGARAGEAARLVTELGRGGRTRGGRALAWASAGAGMAALGLGGYFLDLEGRTTCGDVPIEQCPRLHATAPLGWTLIGGGIAAIAFGAYWYTVRGRARTPAIAVRRSGAGGFATIAWSF